MDAGLLRELRALSDHPDHLYRPVEDSIDASSGALNWYLLIKAMEEFRRVTGDQLPEVWEHVRRAEYHEAMEVFEATVLRWRKNRAVRRR